MRTLLRIAPIALLVLPALVWAGPPTPVQAPMQAPAPTKMLAAPAPTPVQAPPKTVQAPQPAAPAATAPAQPAPAQVPPKNAQAYRGYSYQPSYQPQYYQPQYTYPSRGYRTYSYQPGTMAAGGVQPTYRSQRTGSGFNSAGHKITGF